MISGEGRAAERGEGREGRKLNQFHMLPQIHVWGRSGYLTQKQCPGGETFKIDRSQISTYPHFAHTGGSGA